MRGHTGHDSGRPAEAQSLGTHLRSAQPAGPPGPSAHDGVCNVVAAGISRGRDAPPQDPGVPVRAKRSRNGTAACAPARTVTRAPWWQPTCRRCWAVRRVPLPLGWLLHAGLAPIVKVTVRGSNAGVCDPLPKRPCVSPCGPAGWSGSPWASPHRSPGLAQVWRKRCPSPPYPEASLAVSREASFPRFS